MRSNELKKERREREVYVGVPSRPENWFDTTVT